MSYQQEEQQELLNASGFLTVPSVNTAEPEGLYGGLSPNSYVSSSHIDGSRSGSIVSDRSFDAQQRLYNEEIARLEQDRQALLDSAREDEEAKARLSEVEFVRVQEGEGQKWSFECMGSNIAPQRTKAELIHWCELAIQQRQAISEDKTKAHFLALLAEKLERLPECDFEGAPPAYSAKESDMNEDAQGSTHMSDSLQSEGLDEMAQSQGSEFFYGKGTIGDLTEHVLSLSRDSLPKRVFEDVYTNGSDADSEASRSIMKKVKTDGQSGGPAPSKLVYWCQQLLEDIRWIGGCINPDEPESPFISASSKTQLLAMCQAKANDPSHSDEYDKGFWQNLAKRVVEEPFKYHQDFDTRMTHQIDETWSLDWATSGLGEQLSAVP